MKTFDVKCGLNADHFSSLIRRHSTNFSNCGSACKHCTCWQPRCHNEFLLVGSINALHIKFQGWTFIVIFSTAYQSWNRDPFLMVCYQSSQFMTGVNICPKKSETVDPQIWVFWNCLPWSTRKSSKLSIKIFLKLSDKIFRNISQYLSSNVE